MDDRAYDNQCAAATSRGTHAGHTVRLQILGPLRLWRDSVELDPGPRQQAYLLGLLLARVNEPISTNELIELIWGETAPASALNILHKYVGVLRRTLEPELAPRNIGSYLVRRGDAYLFLAGPSLLDLVTFRKLAAAAEAFRSEQRTDQALDRYVEALALWHGPSGAGWHHGPAAMPTFHALDGEFFDRCVAAAELAVSFGQPERVLPHLQQAALMAPLHEAVQASLITVLGATGQQAEALTTFRVIRAHLAQELGIEPGPALQTAHQHVLQQNPTTVRRPATVRPTGERPSASRELVGRSEELAALRRTVGAALADGAGLALVQGEPGVGKTRLLQEAAAEAHRSGAHVVWGNCLDGDGTPSMWPWIQAVGALLDVLPAAARRKWLDAGLSRLVDPSGTHLAPATTSDNGAQFRLLELVVSVVRDASARQPVVLAIDDLQWADPASLQLFSHLTRRLPPRTSVIGAFRDRAPTPGSALSELLAAASRVPGHHRVQLGNLNPAEITELVLRETGRQPSPADARILHARTAGNPFFIRELSRVLTKARGAVPATVQDIVRDRMAALSDSGQVLLQIAALIGRDVELDVLASAAGLDLPACLELLEPMDALALLEPRPRSPFSFRFVHDLVRESITGSIPPPRIPRLHRRIADAMEKGDPERLAYHLWAAGPLAEPDRTCSALIRAGRHAMAKAALTAAERHLRSAARLARDARLPRLELSALTTLTAVVGMRTMYDFSSPELLERAEHLARDFGLEREATEFLYSRRAGHSQAVQLDRSGPLARRLLDQGAQSADPVVRAYGAHAWGIHQWDVGNIGESFRHLSQRNEAFPAGLAGDGDNRLRHDLRLISTLMLAMITALHGDLQTARRQLDAMEIAGDDDPFAVTVWAAFAATVAALAGDPAWAMRAAQRGIARDPDFTFVCLGTYQRLARCWARAMTGRDPARAAAEADQLITVHLTDPPQSNVSTWYVALGEMWLAAGEPERAAAALDRAENLMEATGQRYAEGLYLLLRARVRQAAGEPAIAVRTAAEQARAISAHREAGLFVRRADAFLEDLAARTPKAAFSAAPVG